MNSYKIYLIMLLQLCCLPMAAQLNGTGYYRIRNAQNTNDYISMANDKFNYLTAISTACGGLGQASSSAGQARAFECVGRFLQTDIHMVGDAECINPGAVVYAQKRNTNTSNYDYNLIGQGTSLLTLTTGTYDGTLDLVFKDRYITIEKVSGSGIGTLYTAKIELKSSTYSSLANLGFRYFVDNEGTFGINASSSNQNAKWYIEPVTHFNVNPEVEFGGKYYTTLYVPFAYKLNGNVEKAYAIKSIPSDGNLEIEEVAANGGTVPAGTPVLLECSSSVATECQLIPSGAPLYTAPQNVSNANAPTATTATNYTGVNVLSGTYFSNQDGSLSFSTPNGTGTINANNFTAVTNPQKYVVGITTSGKLGFVKASGTAMPANKAWLEYTGTAELVLPFEATKIGDVNRDGLVDVNDVTALVDIILGKDPDNVFDHVAANVNNDNIIDVSDVTALIDIILGKEE